MVVWSRRHARTTAVDRRDRALRTRHQEHRRVVRHAHGKRRTTGQRVGREGDAATGSDDAHHGRKEPAQPILDENIDLYTESAGQVVELEPLPRRWTWELDVAQSADAR